MRAAADALTPIGWELAETAPDTVETVVDADAPVFAGHYPGRPVVPGVCLVDLVGQAAARLGLAAPTPALLLDRARFTDPVLPGDHLTVVFDPSSPAGQVAAVVSTQRGIACRVRLRIAEAAT
jgi:3-hydroxyacyl-[acyl-carrier-protein] dehydratase